MRLHTIEQILTRHHPAPAPAPNRPSVRRAAVAIILREHTETEVLFIRRAEKPGDPWSGHMAFPGGHADRDDPALLDTARRETREEIGLDLESAGRHIGSLEHHQVTPRGRTIDMLIAPQVFAVTAEMPFRPNHEVAEVVWTPLAPIVSGANHTTEDRIVGGVVTTFNGYRVNGGHFVWGLTYRILHALFGVLDPAWRPPALGKL